MYFRFQDLFEKNKYLAHYTKDVNKINDKTLNLDEGKEYLETHLENTLETYHNLIVELSIDFKPFFQDLNLSENEQSQFIELFDLFVYFHDLGKINPMFQYKIRANNNLDVAGIDFESISSSEHSSISYHFLQSYLAYLKNNKQITDKTYYIAQILSTIVLKHHSTLSDLESLIGSDNLNKDSADLYKHVFMCDYNNSQTTNLQNILNNKVSLYPNLGSTYEKLNLDDQSKSSLFYLYKLLYSLLINSDILCSFKLGVVDKFSDVFENSLLDNIENNLINKFVEFDEYNKTLSKESMEYLLNKMRTDFREQSLNNLDFEDNVKKDIFYLYLPTGGGKTLTAFQLALKLAKKYNSNKLVYVFPFINIIEQNAKEIMKVTGDLDANNFEKIVSPIYSLSDFEVYENIEDSTDEDYEKAFMNINTLNYKLPIISSVAFFDSFIMPNKKSNLRLFNLYNSVVIIDEIQSLSDYQWTLFANFLLNTSKYYKIKYIIMSATLPRFTNLLEDGQQRCKTLFSEDDYYKLVNGNDLFFKRCSIDTLRNDKNNIIDDYDSLCDKIKESVNSNAKTLVVFNTVGESKYFFENVSKYYEKNANVEVMLLNSTILPEKREDIIIKIKNPSYPKKLLLISTQAIEAGVDVSFNVAFRQISPLDSILQVAGRVNRNFEMDSGKLYIFGNLEKLKEKEKDKNSQINYENTRKIYRGIRFNNILNKTNDEVIEILNDSVKYKLEMDLLIEKIIYDNEKNYLVWNQFQLLDLIENLQFNKLRSQRVISTDSTKYIVKNKEYFLYDLNYKDVMKNNENKKYSEYYNQYINDKEALFKELQTFFSQYELQIEIKKSSRKQNYAKTNDEFNMVFTLSEEFFDENYIFNVVSKTAKSFIDKKIFYKKLSLLKSHISFSKMSTNYLNRNLKEIILDGEQEYNYNSGAKFKNIDRAMIL